VLQTADVIVPPPARSSSTRGCRAAAPWRVCPVSAHRLGRAGSGLQPGAVRGLAAHPRPRQRRGHHRRDPVDLGRPGPPRQADHPGPLRILPKPPSPGSEAWSTTG